MMLYGLQSSRRFGGVSGETVGMHFKTLLQISPGTTDENSETLTIGSAFSSKPGPQCLKPYTKQCPLSLLRIAI
jgi:hypothetical protein